VKPRNASERGPQFFHGYGFNRWYDKTIQFAVCDNGDSAGMAEHSHIDGAVISRLFKFVAATIRDFKPEIVGDQQELQAPTIPQGYAFTTTAELDQHITRVRHDISTKASKREFDAYQMSSVGSNFFRGYKCPPKSGMQLIILLACRRYFGYNPAAHETIALNHFRKGRVDVSPMVWLEVERFCSAAMEFTTPTRELRDMFFEAMRVHAKNLIRATRGQGFDRHFSTMAWYVDKEKGEKMPMIWESDLYEWKARPTLAMTDCSDMGIHEVGSVLPSPASFWMHFELDNEMCVIHYPLPFPFQLLFSSSF
jgi:hypothetical protein